jgi:hypothetical protein
MAAGSFGEALDTVSVRGNFYAPNVTYNTGNSTWELQNVLMEENVTLTGATDLSSATAAAETWASAHGYVRMTYWSQHSSSDAQGIWFLPF